MKNAPRSAKPISWVMSLLMIALIAGCGGGGGTNGTGTLGVSLTDDPACGFSAVNVTVTKVRVHQSATANETDAGWTDIALNPPRKINLLNLTNGVLTSLGDTPLTAGHYTQLRLVLDSNTGSTIANSVVPSGTSTEMAMDTPSALQSGIKLINEFDVAAGQRVDLALDFDACKSVVTRGNGKYLLMPVVTVVPFVVNGIDGFVPTSFATSNVIASAQQNGKVVASTVASSQTGEFFIARLAPGNYDVVITADSHATAVITAVPVATSTSITVVSTAAAPINLPTSVTHNASGTELLNPTSTIVAAYVDAKQAVSTSTTVTVKSQPADAASGAYTLILPVAAPLLGAYSATLPIALTAQSAAAGKYTLAATATGYTTQTANVDLSTADVAHNFTLVP